jgi:serine/threonine protein kinase
MDHSLLNRRVTVYSPFHHRNDSNDENLAIKQKDPLNIYKKVYSLDQKKKVEVIIKIKQEESEQLKIFTIRQVAFNTNAEYNITNLRHQNIVKILEIYKYSQNVYIISELIDISLVQIRCLYTYINEKQLSSIIKQMFEVILYLTSKQRIHPKIRLQNLLINRDGCLKLSKFTSGCI